MAVHPVLLFLAIVSTSEQQNVILLSQGNQEGVISSCTPRRPDVTYTCSPGYYSSETPRLTWPSVAVVTMPKLAVLLVLVGVFLPTLQQDAHDCLKPPESGMCMAYIPSYYWNDDAKQCLQFIYGGCGGNKNRFRSIPDCEAACKHP